MGEKIKERVYICKSDKDWHDRYDELTNKGLKPKLEWRDGKQCVVVYLEEKK